MQALRGRRGGAEAVQRDRRLTDAAQSGPVMSSVGGGALSPEYCNWACAWGFGVNVFVVVSQLYPCAAGTNCPSAFPVSFYFLVFLLLLFRLVEYLLSTRYLLASLQISGVRLSLSSSPQPLWESFENTPLSLLFLRSSEPKVQFCPCNLLALYLCVFV
eukprot:RCo027808